jgi:tetratricopeptide (TPR) repeat protein
VAHNASSRPEWFRGAFFIPRRLSLVGILALCFLAYLPGLWGGFVFDDSVNLIENNQLQIETFSWDALSGAALSGNAGMLKRPISMASFALNHLATGLDPFYFKLTNLCLHLLNGVLVYWFTQMLWRAARFRCQDKTCRVPGGWVPLLASAFWLLHPIQLTSVLYVVQRMTSLSAIFTLLGLIFYVWGRLRLGVGRRGWPFILTGTFVFGLLSVLSKENGALLPIYALACEPLLFRLNARRARERRLVLAYFAGILWLPAIVATGYVLTHPDGVLGGYAAREFSLCERLLTEARVLWSYLGLILVPNHAALGLYHDDIAISTGILAPVTTAPAVLGLLGMVLAAWFARRSHPILAFAIFWFLGGHLMESTVIPLEIAHEHRNYLPVFGPLLAVVYYLFRLTNSPRFGGFAAAMVLLLGVATAIRAEQWRDPFSLALMEVRHHPASSRAHYELGRLYFDLNQDGSNLELDVMAKEHFIQAARLAPYRQKPYFALIMLASRAGKAPEPWVLSEMTERLQSQPYQSDESRDFKLLGDCQFGGICHLSHAQVLEIFGAALNNPTLTLRNKVLLLTQLASYYANAMGDLKSGIDLFSELAREYPDDVYARLNLAQALTVAGNLNEARKHIAEAERLDVLGTYRMPIAVEKARMKKQERGGHETEAQHNPAREERGRGA